MTCKVAILLVKYTELIFFGFEKCMSLTLVAAASASSPNKSVGSTFHQKSWIRDTNVKTSMMLLDFSEISIRLRYEGMMLMLWWSGV